MVFTAFPMPHFQWHMFFYHGKVILMNSHWRSIGVVAVISLLLLTQHINAMFTRDTFTVIKAFTFTGVSVSHV